MGATRAERGQGSSSQDGRESGPTWGQCLTDHRSLGMASVLLAEIVSLCPLSLWGFDGPSKIVSKIYYDISM